MAGRRGFVIGSTAAVAGATAAVLARDAGAQTRQPTSTIRPGERLPPGQPVRDYTPVVTPNGSTLPWRDVGGVKVFHLVAEEVRGHAFRPGLVVDAWGYNGSTPGPTIELVEGDRVRIYVTNRLPEATSVHWHGVILPNGMDGVAGLNQRRIDPGETFKYEFQLRFPGTFMYHPHFDEMTQMALGMMGMIVVHPRRPRGPRPDRDFSMMLSEWKVEPGARRPDPTVMTDFNVITFNSKAFPGTAPLVAKTGDRVRMRFGNLGAMDHHPVHLHGYAFRVVATDGGPIPEAGQWPETTVLVPVGSTRDVEFIADAPGDWAIHCHMTHHVMTQMGHDLPNILGVDARAIDRRVGALVPGTMTMGNDGMGAHAEHVTGMPVPPNSTPMGGGPGPFGNIDMGGMFTVVKVRDGLTSYDDPGWYRHPAGTVAEPASAADLRTDGVDPASTPRAGD